MSSANFIHHTFFHLNSYRKANPKPNFPESFAELLGHCGWYLYERGQYSVAITILSTAAEILEAKQGDNPNPTSGFVCNNLSRAYSIKAMFQESIPCSLKAIHHREGCLPPNHPSLATSYMNYGEDLYDIDDHVEAAKYMEMALNIRRTGSETTPAHLEQALSNYGRNFTAAGKLEEALEALSEALELKPRCTPPLSVYTAQTIWHLGNLRLAQGDVEAGEKLHKQCLDERTQLLGNSHMLTASSQHKFASMLRTRGKKVDAIKLYERAQKVFEDGDYEAGLLPRTLFTMADVYDELGQATGDDDFLQKAKTYRTRATDLRASLPSPELPCNKIEHYDKLVQKDLR